MARPLKFKTPEEFDLMVDLYQAHCVEQRRYMTIPGLALFLGFACKQSLYDYQQKEEFSESVKRARALIEDATVNVAMGTSGGGPIFILKNMGYTDKQTVQIDPITVNISGKDADL